MSLAGLLSILDDDPRLRDVVARADVGPDLPDTDLPDTNLVAPPALRPVLTAALTRGGEPGTEPAGGSCPAAARAVGASAAGGAR